MLRLGWSQLRFQPARAVALLVGMLLATTAFTVLTAAARTSQLRTTGAVTRHFRATYDILVRPRGARTPLERATGTVAPNFLSGIYGGISLAQYHQIQAIPGVQVAAPIAMVGYSLPLAFVTVPLPATGRAPGRQIYRLATTWISAAGGKIRQPPSYLYRTPDRFAASQSSASAEEVLPDGSKAGVCPSTAGGSPFGIGTQADNWCWSAVNGLGPGEPGYQTLSARRPGFTVRWSFPMLIAAIDPAAEARLDGLNKAVTSGSYLAEHAGDRHVNDALTTFPVLATASSGIGERAVTTVSVLPQPHGVPRLNAAGMRAAARQPGRVIATIITTAAQAYRQLLAEMARKHGVHTGIFGYWTAGPVSYRRGADGALTPVPVTNPASAWRSPQGIAPPMDEEGSQYRAVTSHLAGTSFTGGIPAPILAGVFDPARIGAGDPLSSVPIGPYAPAADRPASAASRAALGGADLAPSLNLAGYVSQPVNLITTMAALPALENSGVFGSGLHAADPISVIRVRVAGVTGPGAVSRERINEVAQQIAVRTGLTVDIVTGSSPAPVTVDLPAGRLGQPPLRLTEGWVRKGIAVAILTAVDSKSLSLFVLVLVVCGLFVANSATAAVRGRRRELGVLACIGWTRTRIFGTVLGELTGLGLLAGLLGGGLSVPLAAALGLHPSAGRALLAVPVAVAVALSAGAVPAWLASRASPLAGTRPPVLAARRGYHPRGITGLAVLNLARSPGRSLLGAVSLAVGVAGLTLVAAITIAFRGLVVGSLLGDAVAVQVRGVDYVAIGATVILGVLAVADVLAIGIRERAAELATIRQLGWPERALARLVVTEGLAIGVTGSLAGAAAGLFAAARLAAALPAALLVTAAAAVLAGTLVTAGAALLPARALRALPAARLLSEE